MNFNAAAVYFRRFPLYWNLFWQFLLLCIFQLLTIIIASRTCFHKIYVTYRSVFKNINLYNNIQKFHDWKVCFFVQIIPDLGPEVLSIKEQLSSDFELVKYGLEFGFDFNQGQKSYYFFATPFLPLSTEDSLDWFVHFGKKETICLSLERWSWHFRGLIWFLLILIFHSF